MAGGNIRLVGICRFLHILHFKTKCRHQFYYIKIPEFLKRHSGNTDKNYAIKFEPLKDAYLHSAATRQPGAIGSLTNIYIFALIAFFILIIACINFMNLSTAVQWKEQKKWVYEKCLARCTAD
jgi:hypothetical protein